MRIRVTVVVELLCDAPRPVTNFNAKVDRLMKTVNLNWDLPTTRVDGSALLVSEIAGVLIQISADNGANFSDLEFVQAPDNALVVPDLVDGDYIFRAIVVDKQAPPLSSAATDRTINVSSQPGPTPTPTVLAAPSPIAELRITIS